MGDNGLNVGDILYIYIGIKHKHQSITCQYVLHLRHSRKVPSETVERNSVCYTSGSFVRWVVEKLMDRWHWYCHLILPEIDFGISWAIFNHWNYSVNSQFLKTKPKKKKMGEG